MESSGLGGRAHAGHCAAFPTSSPINLHLRFFIRGPTGSWLARSHLVGTCPGAWQSEGDHWEFLGDTAVPVVPPTSVFPPARTEVRRRVPVGKSST